MSNVDQRFALLDLFSNDKLFPYMKQQSSTGRFGFALSRPGNPDKHGKGYYTTDIREVIRLVVIDGWSVRAKTIDKVGRQREGSIGLGKKAIDGYWVSPEFLELVKGCAMQPTTLLQPTLKSQHGEGTLEKKNTATSW